MAVSAATTQMADIDIQQDYQRNFLQGGGIYRNALTQGYKNGTLVRPSEYVFQEYPKYLKLSKGFEDVQHETENVKGKTITWTVREELFDEVIVNDAAEEAKVMKGRTLVAGAAPSTVATITPAAAAVEDDSIEALEARLADMKKKAALRREIADLAASEALEAAIDAPEADAEPAKRPTLSLSPSKPTKAA